MTTAKKLILKYTGLLISLVFHLLILFAPITLVVVEGHNFHAVELMVTEGLVPSPSKNIKDVSIPKVKQATPSKVQEINQALPEKPPTFETNTPEQTLFTDKGSELSRSDDKPVAAREFASVQVPLSSVNKPLEVAFGSNLGPAFMHRESPHYPLLARRMGKEGKVILRLTIDEKGKLQNIEVVKGESYGFTEAAVKAVKTSTFRPAMNKGKPVPSSALLPINFVLKEG